MDGLAVVGAVVVDEFMTVAELPAPQQSVHARSYSRATGGKASNQAVAASLSGGSPVSLLASIGSDSLGDVALADIAATGVDISACHRVERATGRSFIVVDERGEQIVSTWPGASSVLSPSHVRAFVNDLAAPSWVSLQGETQHTAVFVELALSAGHKVVLNPSPIDQFQSGFPWHLVDVVVANEIEANTLGDELARVDIVVTTRGAEGLTLRQGEAVEHIASPSVAVVDTTGAGDAFAGVMSARLAAGSDIHDAVRAGMAAATISVTRPHCIPSYPTQAEIEDLIPSIRETRP